MVAKHVYIQHAWFANWYKRSDAKLRIFCFPYAGGGASIYRKWQHSVPRHIEICPVQLPGRENRIFEKPISHMPALIDTLIETLTPHLDKPYAFFGHSMGALISFELTRAIQRMRTLRTPHHLFVSAYKAPHIQSTRSSTHQLPDSLFIEELRTLNGTPKEVLQSSEYMKILLPALRADFSLCQTYTYKDEPPITCPISAFGGLQDKVVKPHDIHAWQKQTRSGFIARFYQGDHFFIHTNHSMVLRSLTFDLYHMQQRH